MAEVKKNEFFSHLVADVLHRVVNRSCLSLEPDDFPICSLAARRVDVDVARARRIGVLHVKQLRNDQLRDCRHQLSETMTEYRRSRRGESCQHQFINGTSVGEMSTCTRSETAPSSLKVGRFVSGKLEYSPACRCTRYDCREAATGGQEEGFWACVHCKTSSVSHSQESTSPEPSAPRRTGVS